jgi:uncharacterized protein with PQ loop repeat
MVTILAWTGALLSCLLTIPQAARTLRSDQLAGLSATTYWLIFGNAAVWAAWSALSGEYAAGVPALVNGPAALLILRRLHRSQRSVEPEYVGDPARAQNPRSIQSVGDKMPRALPAGLATTLFSTPTASQPAACEGQATDATRPRPISRIVGHAASASSSPTPAKIIILHCILLRDSSPRPRLPDRLLSHCPPSPWPSLHRL